MKKLGIMQGRLLPKYLDRFQAHPVGYWQSEFDLASKRKLDCIEFILDFNDFNKNPLIKKNGYREILDQVEKTGVQVNSVCADYFMKAPFHSSSTSVVNQSEDVFFKLLNSASKIGVKHIVLPCVDESSLSITKFNLFKTNIKNIIKKSRFYEIDICLETDLNPIHFYDLLKDLPSDTIKVNYDSGNSASLGYDIEEEFDAYGDRIVDIHIKDRIFEGPSVTLGSGDVNFLKFKHAINKLDDEVLLIMQAYRDDEGTEIFDDQLFFFNELMRT